MTQLATKTDKSFRQYELPGYDFLGIEKKWQHTLEKNKSHLPGIKLAADIVREYGIDALRLNTLSMSLDSNTELDIDTIRESSRYLNWVWITGSKHIEMILAAIHRSCSPQICSKRENLLFSKLNKTITTANKEINDFYFHGVAVVLRELSAGLHDYLIANDPNEELVGTVIINLIKMLSIFCPFLCEELWQQFGYENSIFEQPWPSIVSMSPKREELSIPVRINGILQQVLQVPADTGKEDTLLTIHILEHPVIKRRLASREISKVIASPDQEINIVTR